MSLKVLTKQTHNGEAPIIRLTKTDYSQYHSITDGLRKTDKMCNASRKTLMGPSEAECKPLPQVKAVRGVSYKQEPGHTLSNFPTSVTPKTSPLIVMDNTIKPKNATYIQKDTTPVLVSKATDKTSKIMNQTTVPAKGLLEKAVFGPTDLFQEKIPLRKDLKIEAANKRRDEWKQKREHYNNVDNAFVQQELRSKLAQ
jgi:hypothetical protein